MSKSSTNRKAPAYRVLADTLRREISEGKYPPGFRLPTEMELAAYHGVSRQTVRQAFNDLVARSLVYRVRGRGTFAIPSTNHDSYLRSFGSIDELMALSVDTELEMVSPFEARTDVEAAGRLHLKTDEVVVGTFRRLHRDVVFCVTTTYLPLELERVVRMERALLEAGARTPATIIGLIDRYADHPVAGAHQSITAVTAPQQVAERIECTVGAPVLRVDRLYYNRAGEFVELAVSHFHPARYSYRVELRRASLTPSQPE